MFKGLSITKISFSDRQALEYEGLINKNELLKALTSMDNNEMPANDGITGKFYVEIWDFPKKPLCASIQQSFLISELSAS